MKSIPTPSFVLQGSLSCTRSTIHLHKEGNVELEEFGLVIGLKVSLDKTRFRGIF